VHSRVEVSLIRLLLTAGKFTFEFRALSNGVGILNAVRHLDSTDGKELGYLLITGPFQTLNLINRNEQSSTIENCFDSTLKELDTSS
jgi:hypothetical protein